MAHMKTDFDLALIVLASLALLGASVLLLRMTGYVLIQTTGGSLFFAEVATTPIGSTAFATSALLLLAVTLLSFTFDKG